MHLGHSKVPKRQSLHDLWNCIEGYQDGSTYYTIMSEYFSGKSTGKNKTHTKISNSQLA